MTYEQVLSHIKDLIGTLDVHDSCPFKSWLHAVIIDLLVMMFEGFFQGLKLYMWNKKPVTPVFSFNPNFISYMLISPKYSQTEKQKFRTDHGIVYVILWRIETKLT